MESTTALLNMTHIYLVSAEWVHYVGCGKLGAFLMVAADYYVPVGLALKEKPFLQKLLFILAGGGTAFVYFTTPASVIYVAFVVGAGWPYFILGLKSVAKTWSDGHKLKSIGISPDELIQAARDGTDLHSRERDA